jgi:hypothetical protein
MKASSVRAIFKALQQFKVRFLLAGGLAVNAYGFLRQTKDVDIVIELVPDNIAAAFQALASVGYRPLVPISADQFSDPRNREIWMREKEMKVLQFWSDEHLQTPVDVFVHVPFDFSRELANAPTKELIEVGHVPIVSLRTLVSMKQAANREQDQIDLSNLRLLYLNKIPSHG